MDTQDKKDFLMEKEGRYIYDAGMSEAAAMRKAQEDLSRLEKERGNEIKWSMENT